MSYTALSKTNPRARKNYSCAWCDQTIFEGEVHSKWCGVSDGDFQWNRMHTDCAEACDQYFKRSGEEYFDPGAFKRGSTEER